MSPLSPTPIAASPSSTDLAIRPGAGWPWLFALFLLGGCGGPVTPDCMCEGPLPDGSWLEVECNATQCAGGTEYECVGPNQAEPRGACGAADAGPLDDAGPRCVPVFPDCDGDGYAAAGAASAISCDAPAQASGCGLGEVSAWTEADPSDQPDCDDHARSIGPATTFHVDCDGDGFAPAGLGTVVGCVAPTELPAPCGGGGAWTSRAPTTPPYTAGNTTTDCDDANPSVHPGVTEWRSEPIAGAPPARGFDYDCDGAETAELPDRYDCDWDEPVPDSFFCRAVRSGWADGVPPCGESAPWADRADGCSVELPIVLCEPNATAPRALRCR